MKFEVKLVPSADEDLDFYGSRDQRVILDAVEEFLGVDADLESKRRKRLRPNPLAPWALRVGDYRVFYEIAAEQLVRVLAVGHKVHNDLFIRNEGMGPRLDIGHYVDPAKVSEIFNVYPIRWTMKSVL